MRTKDEILKYDQGISKEGIHDRLNIGRRDLLILEVLIDIRDIHKAILGVLGAYYEDGITPK